MRVSSSGLRATCLAILLSIPALGAPAKDAPRFKAVAFDYFVLFNANSITRVVETVVPGHGQEFVNVWRSKQFEYGFLRSITHQHKDFFAVTSDALTYTASLFKVELTREKRQILLNAYLSLDPWPDAVDGLNRLRAAGVKIITIANFSPKMLKRNAEHAGIEKQFDELISTHENHTYKPDAQAYALGLSHLHLKKEEVLYAAFGGWDAYGAKSFGYPTYWVNRFHLPPEQLEKEPDAVGDSMAGLLQYVLGSSSETVPTQPATIAINVALEPDDTITKKAEAENVRLRQGYSPGFAFDGTHLPHITLVQRFVHFEKLAEIKSAVGKVMEPEKDLPIPLRAVGFTTSEWEGQALASYKIDSSPALQRLEEKMVAAVEPFAVAASSEDAFVRDDGEPINAKTIQYVQDFVPKNSGRNYKPHLTLGLTTLPEAKKLEKSSFDPFPFKALRVTVYQLGNNGTARKKL